jgi:predicted metal-dependent peptidase
MIQDLPHKRITRARSRLLLGYPWFGSLAMRLRIVENPAIETFDVDGTTMRYNPAFVDTLPDDELQTVIAHEVMHCALLHPFRRAQRDMEDWNKACDYAINGQLVAAGFKLPEGGLIDPQYDGLSADVIYARLGKKPKDNNGAGGAKPGMGDVQDAPKPGGAGADGTPPMSESDWKIATEQANAVAKAAGKMPGGIEENIDAANKPVEDWHAILREFVEHTVPKDYSWTSPNRRHVANGIYLPGMTKENLGHIVVAVDTSGSIDTRLLQVFSAELNAIALEAKPERVTVVYCDTGVNRVEEFGPDEEIRMQAVGRGGTAFQPVFDQVATWPEEPACLIYFTDLDGPAPQEPTYPVLWATSLSVTGDGPFGRTVRVTEH